MKINYFGQYGMDTQELEEKKKVIAKHATENASFMNHTFWNAVEYLFQPITLATEHLIQGIPNSLSSDTIVIYFDSASNTLDNKMIALSQIVRQLIIVGNHPDIKINDKIEYWNIRHFSKLSNIMSENTKVQWGCHLDAIGFEKYYYGRMRTYFLNVLHGLYEIPLESLKAGVEESCTQLLLNESNFTMPFSPSTRALPLKQMIVFYMKFLQQYGKIFLWSEKMFYQTSKESSEMQNAKLNALSELVKVAQMEEKQQKISYLYDSISRQMLEEANRLQYCHFMDNACVAIRYTDNTFPHSKVNGCCNNTYLDKGKNCRYLNEDHSCAICSISCRVFTCGYLQKRGIDHALWQYPLVDCFLKQFYKSRIVFGFFTPKEKMMKKLKNGLIAMR